MAMVEDIHSKSLFPDEEYWIENISDSDEEYHDVKRQRIDKLARKYEAGSSLYISTARLKGPFGSGWKNPWQNRRRIAKNTSGSRVATVSKPESITVRQRCMFADGITTDSPGKPIATPTNRKEKKTAISHIKQENGSAIQAQESRKINCPAECVPESDAGECSNRSNSKYSPLKSSAEASVELEGFQAMVSQVTSLSRPVITNKGIRGGATESNIEPPTTITNNKILDKAGQFLKLQSFQGQEIELLRRHGDDYGLEPSVLEEPKLDMDTSPSSAGQRSGDGPLSPGFYSALPLTLLPDADGSMKSRSVTSSFVAEEDGLTGWLDEASGFLQDWTVEREIQNTQEE